MNKQIQRHIAEHDGPDPLDDEDYTIIKGMVIGTGKIDLLELGYLLTKNLAPFIETIAKINQVHQSSPDVYEVDLTQFKNEEDFLSQVKNLARRRMLLAKPPPKQVHPFKAGWKIIGFKICLIVFFYLLIAYFISGFDIRADSLIAAAIRADFLIVAVTIGGVIWWLVPIQMFIFPYKFRTLGRDYLKIVNYLESYENFATISELALAVKVSQQRIINAITSFGKGPMRQSLRSVLRGSVAKLPIEESFYFLPQVDGVMRSPKTRPPSN